MHIYLGLLSLNSKLSPYFLQILIFFSIICCLNLFICLLFICCLIFTVLITLKCIYWREGYWEFTLLKIHWVVLKGVITEIKESPPRTWLSSPTTSPNPPVCDPRAKGTYLEICSPFNPWTLLHKMQIYREKMSVYLPYGLKITFIFYPQ